MNFNLRGISRLSAFAILSPFFLSCLSPAKEGEGLTVFQNVTVIPMDQQRLIQNQDVVIREGRIFTIEPAGSHSYPSALNIDGSGKYLIPGLAEMHAHVPPIDDMEPMKEVLQLYLASGITTIRGMLGHPLHLELRSKINSGEVLGPHFFATGPSFNGNTVTSPTQGAAKVREQKRAGYDFLKLHPGLSRAAFDSIAITAHRLDIPFVGHVSFDVGVWHAIESEYSSIDHLDGFVEGLVPGIEKMSPEETGLFGIFVINKVDTTRLQELMTGLREHHVWVVPTQALAERWMSPADTTTFMNAPEMKYMSAQQVRNWNNSKKGLQSDPRYNAADVNKYIAFRRHLIKKCQDNGVGLLLGSDAPQVYNVPGFSIHHELQYMVDSGLTPYEALQSGTVNVAAYLNQTDAGTIKEGHVADLVLLNGNPLDDIGNSKLIEGVMIGTKWLPRDSLDAMLARLVKQ